MRAALLLTLVLIASACVQAGVTVNESGAKKPSGSYGSGIYSPPTPERAAQDYFSKTYFDTAEVTYSDMTYFVSDLSEAAANVSISFRRVLRAPSYNLTRVMEQKIEVQKAGILWAVTDTPPARIVYESYG